MSDNDLRGKTAVVTGAAGGLGRSIVHALAGAGASLVLVDLADAVQEIGANYGGQVVQADVSATGVAESVMAKAKEAFGGVDLLVNVAGIQARGPAVDLAWDSWTRLVAINLGATYRFCQCAAGLLAERNGAIVNISSLSADRALPGIVPYGALKAAVSQLTRGLAIELGPVGVRVNAVAPGYVLTDMTREMLDDPATRSRILGRVPLGRLATPDDITPTILFLLSDSASYITGEVIAVDGGYAAT